MSALDKLIAIQNGIGAFNLNPQPNVRLKLELKINKFARQILSSHDMKDPESLMNELRLARAELVPNLAGFVQGNLHLNLIQSIKPTPICPAYNKIGVPTVSTYHVIGSNIESARLDPQSIQAVPQSLRDWMGDLSHHRVDLFFTVIDGRPFNRIDHFAQGPMNLSLHSWAHSHAHPGDDVHKYPETGLLPIMGIQKAPAEQTNPRHDDNPRVDPIPFDGLRQFNVHAHMGAGDVLAQNMLYSPDNIHFNLIPDSPFAIFWSGAKTGDRACMTKMLVILDYNDPISQALVESVRNNRTLLSHLEKLQQVVKAIDGYFDPIIRKFTTGNPVEAMQQYQALPEMYKNGIHVETWKLHQQPMGIHADFGRVSFENDPTLDLVRHSSNHQRSQALTAFKESLKQTLANSQIDMFSQDLTLARSDCSVMLMKCARTFQKNADEGLKQFQLLPEEMRHSVHFAFWELSGSPRVADFGTLRFPESSSELKVESLLLAASRQTEVFVPTIIAPVKEVALPVVVQDSSNLSNPDGLNPPSMNPTTPLDLTSNPEENSLARLLELNSSAEFAQGSVEVRSTTVNAVLAPLPNEFQHRVYWHFFDGYRTAYPQEQIGGDNWGGRNIGKDINICINAFLQAQGK